MLGTEAAHVTVSMAGKVTVALGTSSHGQSLATTMAQIAADELGVDIDDVTVIDGETDITPIGGGTGGSRSGVIGGAATHRAAETVRQKVLVVAADMLEAAAQDLEVDRGRVYVRGTPTKSVTLADVAHLAYVDTKGLPAGVEPGLEAVVRYSTPATTYANACHICTVEILGTGKVVLFAVPGAFTPTCSDYHLPGFVLRADELRAKGATTVACISVNDPFVMGAWGRDQKAEGAVVMLADGNGEFTRAVDLQMDGSAVGLGTRSQRYAAVIEDGVVTFLAVEPGPGLNVSSAEDVLAAL